MTFADGTTELVQCIDIQLAPADAIFEPSKIINPSIEAVITFQEEISIRTLSLGQLILSDSTGMLIL